METDSRHLHISLLHPPGGRPPPTWATAEPDCPIVAYFVNRYGEQWVATKIADVLVVAGSDLGWQEIRLTAAKAHAALRLIQRGIGTIAPSAAVPIQGYLLGIDEARWLRAVIGVVFAL